MRWYLSDAVHGRSRPAQVRSGPSLLMIVLTGVAMASLCLAATALAVDMTRRSPALPSAVPATIAVILIGWGALGLVVVLGSASSAVAASSQYALLTLTSILVLIVPPGAHRLGRLSTPDMEPRRLSASASTVNTRRARRWTIEAKRTRANRKGIDRLLCVRPATSDRNGSLGSYERQEHPEIRCAPACNVGPPRRIGRAP